jgi:hypothetical protein
VLLLIDQACSTLSDDFCKPKDRFVVGLRTEVAEAADSHHKRLAPRLPRSSGTARGVAVNLPSPRVVAFSRN